MYRALTLAVLDGQLDTSEVEELNRFVSTMDVSFDDNSVTVDGVDVTAGLRAPEVTQAVAHLAAEPLVRTALVPLQRRLAADRDVVVEGRDIGTVVFPDAEVKVYLTASPAQRALRRARQLGLAEDAEALESLAADIRERDRTDATRESSPLQQAPDAFRLDSTDLTLDEVVAAIVRLVQGLAR